MPLELLERPQIFAPLTLAGGPEPPGTGGAVNEEPEEEAEEEDIAGGGMPNHP